MADYIHPELRNIAADLDEKELSTIGHDVVESYKYDLDSRREWDQKHGHWLNLYYQQDRPINPPWEGASEESLPLLAEACTQFHARSFKAMFPGRNIIKAIPVGKADSHSRERAKRVGAHMSWQLLAKDRRYKRNKDRLLLSLPLHGSFFTKVYYDPIKHRNVVENVRASDLVVPYGTGPRDLEDIERKTQIIWMSLNKTRILADAGYFTKAAVSFNFPKEKSEVDKAHDKAQGVQESPFDPEPLAKILEQHVLLDLDDDGIDEPYIVTVDEEASEVLRIAVRYDTDEAGNPTEDKEPVEYFSHYAYMENPDGFYGLGQGHLISQPNSAVNKLLRQIIDAGTLANIGNHSGFVSQQLGGVSGGELEMSLGKFKKIPGSTDDISKSIFQFKFPGPQPTHFQVIDRLILRADRLSSSSEVLTGQTEKVMQPTTVLALIEQGQEVFSTVYERVTDAWSSELEKLYRLNYKHLDPEEYFAVLDIDGALKDYSVSREDYAPDLQIMPIADPRMFTEQKKLSKAQVEWQFLSTNALVLNSPQHYYNASKRFMEAYGAENTEEVLPNPADAQQVREDDPNIENLSVIQPVPVMPMVFPDQDHRGHIQVHMEFLNNQSKQMSSLARSLLENHVKTHNKMSAGGQSGQGTSGGVAGEPGNNLGLGPGQQAIPGMGLETGGLPGASQEGAGAEGSLGLPGAPAGVPR